MAGKFLVDAMESAIWHTYQRTCRLTRYGLRVMRPIDLIYAVNISPRYGYAYMDNPKTGCSSLKSAMVEMEIRNRQKGLDPYDWHVFHDRSRSPLTRMNDLKSGMSLSALVRSGCQFVTFVRNPYTRLLSCYCDKILGNKPEKLQVLRALGHDDDSLDASISFATFVRVVTDQRDIEMNPHWRVQASQILYDVLSYRFIGRFESFSRDFRDLFRALNIPDCDTPELRHLNRTRSGDYQDCKEYYSADLQELVYQRYRKDFETFGYEYPLPS